MHAFQPTTIPIGNNRSSKIMTSFTITVEDQGVRDALNALASRAQNMTAVLDTIGTGIIERTKRRFETSTDPDGVPWKPNSAATLAMLAARLAGKSSYRKKNGDLNAKGSRVLAGKKPLIGTSGASAGTLRSEIHKLVSENSLSVSSTMAYSAIQQFGGPTGAGSWIPGKTIPARPFLPIHLDGTLYPDDQALILQALNDYLMEGV
jgi:phage gpG-like protein